MILAISADEYHADQVGADVPCLSFSIAKLLCNDTPAHAWWAHPKLNPNWEPKDTAAMDVGRIAHALLLEGVSVAEILDFPDWRTNAAKEARDLARSLRKIPILAKDWPPIQAMVAAAREQLASHKEASDAFTSGNAEQTIIWEEDGVRCKSRLDWLHDDHRHIDDLKTSGVTANPSDLSRTMFSQGWDIQAAMYIRGLRAADPKCNPTFRFIVVENYPPYALSVIGVGPDALMIGEKKVQWAIDKWRECLTSNQWPGYPRRICYPELPSYLENQWLEKEMA